MFPVLVPRLPLCTLRCSPTNRVLGLITHNHACHDTRLPLTCPLLYINPSVSPISVRSTRHSHSSTHCHVSAPGAIVSWSRGCSTVTVLKVHTYRITTHSRHACLPTRAEQNTLAQTPEPYVPDTSCTLLSSYAFTPTSTHAGQSVQKYDFLPITRPPLSSDNQRVGSYHPRPPIASKPPPIC